MKNVKQSILVKTPSGCEMSLEDLCKKEYLKINYIMHMIENEFNISLHDHPDLRSQILDISNFIKRIPNLEKEIM